MEQLAIGFDYGQLDDDARTIVEGCRDEIRRREKRAAEDIIEIGRNLIAVKAAIPHGRFGSWLDAEFGWSAETAQKMMQVARTFGDQIRNGYGFDTRALYALASGTVPKAVREEFIERAEAGESIRYRDVRERIEAEREPPPLLSVVDLETGEIVATAEEYAARPSLADLPPASMPTMREKSREEMAFDRLAAMTIITDLDPIAVADAAADFRAETARLLVRRMPALEAWAVAFADRLRRRLDAPLRAVR